LSPRQGFVLGLALDPLVDGGLFELLHVPAYSRQLCAGEDDGSHV
jgi:hypothetical protein